MGCEVWGVRSGVRAVGVWSEVWDVGCGVWDIGCEVWSVGYGM